MRKIIYILIGVLSLDLCNAVQAQGKEVLDDTSEMKISVLDDVTVTATRSTRKLSNVAVPVTVVSNKTIYQSGSVRLNDILSEQVGLCIFSNQFGQGVQMQGLNPDYTLILINGEPVIGRNGGVLDLSRIAVSNIKKIEIVKGPSSSLYGSEALAGVINIITETPANTSGSVSARYGSFGTANIFGAADFVKTKFKASVQGDYYSTQGYKLDKNAAYNTQDPYHNYTIQFKGEYAFTPKTKWLLNARHFSERQNTAPYTTVDASGKEETVVTNASIEDNALNNIIEHKFSNKLRSAFRLSLTGYKAINDQQYLYSNVADNYYYHDYYKESVVRIEDQTDWNINTAMNLTMGAGGLFDKVSSNRYDEKASTVARKNTSVYAYSQYEWTFLKDWILIAGARFDYNQRYQSAFSPKIAIQKSFGEKIRLKASVGRGFKAPDFSRLYLSFTNNAAGTGYTVLGNMEVKEDIARMQQQGLIQSILIDPNTIQPLKPETSTGINIGVDYKPNSLIGINLNLYRNDISNLINTGYIAQKTNNAFVYSYFNIDKVLTQGVEATVTVKPFKNMQVAAGYQFLYTADKAVKDKVKDGKVFGRENGEVYQLTGKDYFGLFNRSRHTGNLKIFYELEKSWFANLRFIYRSSWGIADGDGNGAYNRGDISAPGFVQTNCSVGKTFFNNWTLHAGCDNVFNYRDVEYLPGMPGRILYATLTCSFNVKKK